MIFSRLFFPYPTLLTLFFDAKLFVNRFRDGLSNSTNIYRCTCLLFPESVCAILEFASKEEANAFKAFVTQNLYLHRYKLESALITNEANMSELCNFKDATPNAWWESRAAEVLVQHIKQHTPLRFDAELYEMLYTTMSIDDLYHHFVCNWKLQPGMGQQVGTNITTIPSPEMIARLTQDSSYWNSRTQYLHVHFSEADFNDELSHSTL